ncbi:hypothetical protein D9M71_478900 [compost metagenome]
MAVTVTAAMMPGRASGSRAFQMIWRVLAPIAWVASMMPLSTSRRAVSTSRAKNGVAPTTSGGMAPATPSEVPVSSTVRGIITISRMMNGSERSTLTTNDSRAYSARFSNICRGPVRNSSTPSGRPRMTVNSSEPPSIQKVSMLAWRISDQSMFTKPMFSKKAFIRAEPPHARRRHSVVPSPLPGRRRPAPGSTGRRAGP